MTNTRFIVLFVCWSLIMACTTKSAAPESTPSDTRETNLTEPEVKTNSLPQKTDSLLKPKSVLVNSETNTKKEDLPQSKPIKKEAPKPLPTKSEPVNTKDKTPDNEINPSEQSAQTPTQELEKLPGEVPNPVLPPVEQQVEEPTEITVEQNVPVIETVSKPDHKIWDELLTKYVTASGKVNYKGIKSEKAKLEAYLKELESLPIQSDWSRGEKMAYWINAYNAFTVKLIVDNYPVSSITKLHGGNAWDVKWIMLGEKTYSLNNIENDILRPRYKDARIHFAVNCAAKSCPSLLNQAWTASNLESNFNKATRAFVNNSQFNKISAKSISVSKIFEWYKEDFENLIDFLNQYSTTEINNNAKVEFMEYDWSLNE